MIINERRSSWLERPVRGSDDGVGVFGVGGGVVKLGVKNNVAAWRRRHRRAASAFRYSRGGGVSHVT